MDDLKLNEAWAQYRDGAITYIEFVRFCLSQVTAEDVREHNAVAPIESRAEWPLAGGAL